MTETPAVRHSSAREWADDQRRVGNRIVFTNGCFDILHAGHIHLLKTARAFGDVLCVGVNTDSSVRRLKGESRPKNSEEDRQTVLEAIRYVDKVLLFEEDTPLELIKAVRPDVLVKGSDYTESEIVGATEVASWGGAVECVTLLPGRSTTALLSGSV